MMTFDPHMNLSMIVVVGLGGTGCQIARSIARICYDLDQRSINTPELVFIDPDRVEQKNVGRQMFTTSDVGQYKAELLARRLNYALGLNIHYRNEAFDHQLFESQTALGRHVGSRYSLLLVGAVDNHEARQELAKVDSCWIDCGNHFSSGQVVIGNTRDWDAVFGSLHNLKDQKQQEIQLLPNVAALFPAMLKPEDNPRPDASCADLVSMGEQHLLINDVIADVASNYVYKILHRQPIPSFISYVDLGGMNVRSLPITPDGLGAYRQKKRKSRTKVA